MGSLSPLHWMLVLLVVVLLFGTGRISGVMGDFAKGLKSFKKHMAEDEDASMEHSATRPTTTISAPTSTTTVRTTTPETTHVNQA